MVDAASPSSANQEVSTTAGGSNKNIADVLSRLMIIVGSASGWVEAWRAEGLMAAAGIDV